MIIILCQDGTIEISTITSVITNELGSALCNNHLKETIFIHFVFASMVSIVEGSH